MNVDVVADVGNSRVKWGRCDAGGVRECAALPADEESWRRQLSDWALPTGALWAVGSVQPSTSERLISFLTRAGFRCVTPNDFRKMPIEVAVDHPEKVGVDRLFNALAARSATDKGQAIAIDAGSAVTVDLIDAHGVFRGGAIFPGLRLMAQALREHTAALPLVTVDCAIEPPGTSTEKAIATGIAHAVAGGIDLLVRKLCGDIPSKVFLTGGDGSLLANVMTEPAILWPEMTLEGIRLAALSLTA